MAGGHHWRPRLAFSAARFSPGSVLVATPAFSWPNLPLTATPLTTLAALFFSIFLVVVALAHPAAPNLPPSFPFQCSFMEYRNYKVVYRRYASLFFIVGTDQEGENELGILEFIHALVETLDKYFENVCELDIMFNLEKAHFILDEMVMNGCLIETNKMNILKPITMIEKAS